MTVRRPKRAFKKTLHPFKSPWTRKLTKMRGLILILLLLFTASAFLYIFWGLPNPANLTTHPPDASTKILDRQGRLLYEIFVDQRRTPIKLDNLPPYVWQATLAAEDKDFFKHKGFSISGISRAFYRTITGSRLEGGSTITQQLVRSALLTQDRTIRRKLREFALSLIVESMYSKNQILEMYLNQVPYGGTAYGLESASQTYFGKNSKDLNIAESALLAGLTAAPSYYSPFGPYPDKAQERQKYVLERMLDNNLITQTEFASASAQTIIFASPPNIKAPHFSIWVKDLLVEKYGLETVEKGGLVVTTSLNLDLQTFAEDTIASEVAKLKKEKVKNGAALVSVPNTGEILAMVGSKDYFDIENDGNVNIVLSKRQPGSAIKPITYSYGFDQKLFTPATILADKPTCFLSPQQDPYCPQNYDNQFHGPTAIRFALGNSFNIPAVKALALAGLQNFIASSSAYGIQSWTDPTKYGPSLTLGGGELNMLELVTAYSVLANSGQKTDLYPILQITDSAGKILESAKLETLDPDSLNKIPDHKTVRINKEYYLVQTGNNTRVISPGAAFLTTHILYDPGARAATFGNRSYLDISGHPEVSVKTGTTNNKRDNWTIGYTPDLIVSVWVGNNDNTPMSNIASGTTGASPIWNKIMTYSLKNQKQHWPIQPSDVTGTLICSITGLKAPENPDPSCQPRYEYFLTGTVPPLDSGLKKDILIFRPLNAPATSRQIIENPSEIEFQNHSVVSDPLGTILCLDCNPIVPPPPDNIRLDRFGRFIGS